MSKDDDYDRDNYYSPMFQPYVMKVERQEDDTFHVWIAGEIGHMHVTRNGLKQLRDSPVLSRKHHDEIVAALAA